MPSGMNEFNDGAPVYGMNTVDDPKRLKEGECVRLLNMLPGNPPVPRNGCTGRLIAWSSSTARFVPPGVAFEYGGTIYIIVWVYDSSIGAYVLAVIDTANGVRESAFAADFLTALPFFDFLALHGNIYCAVSIPMTHWVGVDVVTGSSPHKVVESGLIARDMCINAAAFATSITPSGNSGFLSPSDAEGDGYVEYGFNYVRHNVSSAFTVGATPSGMILPPGIPVNSEPIRVDVFSPGVCIGVENLIYREVKSVKMLIKPEATRLSQSGLGSFNAANCVDGNFANVGFEVDSASAGAYLVIDFGSGQTRNMILFGLFMELAGSTANFKIQYSDNGSTYTDAAVDFIPALANWNYQEVVAATFHRYWRLYLTNAPGAGPNIHEITCYGKTILSFDISQSHATAMAQGATHLRVSRSLIQTTSALAEAATKFWLTDLPIGVSTTSFNDTVTNAALEGEVNQLITGYAVAPDAAFIEYVKGRVYLMGLDGRVYYSESIGGDGGTDLEAAQAQPQPWASLFKPTTYLLDCDYVDGQSATGMKRLGDDLFMFKERKTFALFGGDPLSATISQVSDRIGCAFPYTLTKCEIKGMFEKCLLFLGNDGPMVLQEGGRIRPFSEFKIKELWPDKCTELYSELDLDYDWIVQNCTAAFFKNIWWILYQTKAGVNRIFGYYFNPDLGADGAAPHGSLEFEFASM
jgi:hypothetical protein